MWCPEEVKAPDLRPVSSLPGGSTGVEHAAWTRASWLAFFVVQIIEKMGSKVHYIIKKRHSYPHERALQGAATQTLQSINVKK
jgi:hypothetical protein